MPFISHGVKLYADTGSSSADVEIANLTDIKSPALTYKKVPATTLGQSTDIMQTVPGMGEVSDFEATVQWSAASYAACRALVKLTQKYTVYGNEVVVAGASTPSKYSWHGYCYHVGEIDYSDEKVPVFNIKIAVNTDVTIVAST